MKIILNGMNIREKIQDTLFYPVFPNPQIKQDLYLNGDNISKSVILTDVRINLKNSFYRSLVICY